MSSGRGAASGERAKRRKRAGGQEQSVRRDARDKPPAGVTAGRGGRPTPLLAWVEYSKLVAIALITVFAGLIHYRLLPMVSDEDSFYHIRHSWVYRERGLFDSSFPWAQYSVVKTYAADLWYGLHVLTAPLTAVEPLAVGMYAGALLVTIASLFLLFLAFSRLGVRWPLFWVSVFALISSDLLYRLTMLRPHPLSLGLLVLLFAYLVTDRSRSSPVIILVLAALSSWIHIALWWLPVLLAGVVTAVRLCHRQAPQWNEIGALCAGLGLGIFLRPNPVGALRLAYIQVVELMVAQRQDLPLRFGRELYPFYWTQFVDQFIPLTILLIMAAVVLIVLWRTKRFVSIALDTRVAIWSSLAMAAVFCVLTFTVARRSHEVFVAFAIGFVALLASHWLRANRGWGARVVVLAGILTLAYAPIRTISRFDEIITTAFYPGTFQEVSLWLARNAQPGEIVFHPYWDRFGELFFWNPWNFYINGMDPIFEYAYSPPLYWETHYYALDAADAHTCRGHPCLDEQTVPTYGALKNDFKASYVVLEASRNPKLNGFLATAPGFTKVLATDTGVVLYKID